jgi:hypothetical protein
MSPFPFPSICLRELAENFSGPSSEADAYFDFCYIGCFDAEVARLIVLAKSGPIEIQPE